MPQIEPLESSEPCEPPLRLLSKSSLIFIGKDSRGNWVVRDQIGLFGGLFVNRSEALRFAMLENGRRPRAVIMVPGILEFGISGPPKAVANDRVELAKPQPQPQPAYRPHGFVASASLERSYMLAARA